MSYFHRPELGTQQNTSANWNLRLLKSQSNEVVLSAAFGVALTTILAIAGSSTVFAIALSERVVTIPPPSPFSPPIPPTPPQPPHFPPHPPRPPLPPSPPSHPPSPPQPPRLPPLPPHPPSTPRLPPATPPSPPAYSKSLLASNLAKPSSPRVPGRQPSASAPEPPTGTRRSRRRLLFGYSLLTAEMPLANSVM